MSMQLIEAGQTGTQTLARSHIGARRGKQKMRPVMAVADPKHDRQTAPLRRSQL